MAKYLCLSKLFTFSNIKTKNIIFVNVRDILNLEYIKNYIYSKDILVLLGNLIKKNDIRIFLEVYKNNEIIEVINTKKENNKLFINKKFKTYICKYE
jgi:hypothetical protein